MQLWRGRGSGLLVLGLCLFSAVIFGLGRTHAQTPATNTGLQVEVSPLPILLNAKPGTTTSTDLRVRNPGTTPEQLKLVLKTFTAEGADGHVVLHDPTPADDYLKWVSFSQNPFTAPPGQWQTIHMTVALPASAAFGYYYAVQIEQANPPKPQPGVTHVQGAVAIFVLLNADAPGATKQATVKSFTSDHSIYEFLPVNFNVVLHNSGNVHLAAHGNIFIKRGSKQIATLNVNAAQGLILPGSNRSFTATWNDGFPVYVPVTDGAGNPVKDDKGNVKMHLKWDFSKAAHLRFGHYTAQLLLIYNDGTRDIPIQGTLSFWVVPWRILAGVAVILIFMAIGFWSTFRRVGRFTKKTIGSDKKPEKKNAK